MGIGYQLQYEQQSKTRTGIDSEEAITLLSNAQQCYENGLKAYPKEILAQGAKADDKAKESEFTDFSLDGTVFERITALEKNIAKTTSLLKKYIPSLADSESSESSDDESLIQHSEPAKKESKKIISSKTPTLESLITQSKSLETIPVRDEQIISFNESFWHYTQRNVKPMKKSKLAAYWRTAYLYSAKANEYAESQAFDNAIKCYETQIEKLTTGPILSVKNPDSFLIRRHEIAKAYYQISVLYTQKYQHLMETFIVLHQPCKF